MGKKRRILLVAILVVLLCGLVGWVVFPEPSMPCYQGKSLDYWLAQYQKNSSGSQPSAVEMQQAQEAIRKIGTKALPTLLQMTAAESPAFIDKFKWIINRQSVASIHLRTNFERRWMVTLGFATLGPDARPALPHLMALLGRKNPEVRVSAIRALGDIGPGAESSIPALIKCLDDPDPDARSWAAWALGSIKRKPEIVVPVLIRRLEEAYRATNSYPSVIDALTEYEGYPLTRTAVPRLIVLLSDSDFYSRSAATNALEEIDPAAAAKAGVK